MKVNENNTYLNPEEIKKNAYVILYQRDYEAEKKARIESNKEIVAYDFDGVVHTLMAPDQEADLFGGSHKHPHDLVGQYFTPEHKEKDAAMFLVPHINMTTINDMLQEQNNGNIIAIVTANPFAKTVSGKDKILQLLDYFGIEIDKGLIECSQGVPSGKNGILTNLDPIKFVDDTYSHINDAKALMGTDKKLKQIVLSIPYYANENPNREGKYFLADDFSPSNLNISFSDFKGSGELKENEVTPDKAYKNGIVTLLSYNVYFKSYNDTFYDNNGKNIVEFINNLKPDIMFLCEAGWLCKDAEISGNNADAITLEKYGAPESSAFFVKSESWKHNGSLLYWNSKIFERANDKVGKCDIKYDKLTKGDISNSRPGISVRLKHKETGKHIVVIGVHLDHMKPDSKETNDKFRGIIKDAINYLLTEVDYVDDDQVLLMGDFNEYYGKDGHKDDTLEVTDNKLTLTLKQDKDTCCGVAGEVDHPSKNSLQYKWRSDLLYTNIESMVTDVYKTNTDGKLNSDHSDHYPILGFFDPTDEVKKTKTNGGGDTLQESEMYSFF